MKHLSFQMLLISLVIILTATMLSACSIKGKQGEKLYQTLETLNTSISKKDWKKAESQSKNLNKHYEKNRWKIQLFGDEGEYETLENSLEKLKAAIQTKDDTQSLVEIATIKSKLNQIYSF